MIRYGVSGFCRARLMEARPSGRGIWKLGYMENDGCRLITLGDSTLSSLLALFPWAVLLLCSVSLVAQSTGPKKIPAAPELQKAAQTGDLTLLRVRLQSGDSPNARDMAQRTPLINAVRAGQLGAARILVASGADVNARDVNGVTALIEAADNGRPKSTALLLRAGADVNVRTRGLGSALEAAERAGHQDIVAMLRRAGARSTGKSVGDKVCVRPWAGDGYCGTVEISNKNDFQIHVTEIVGCAGGCPARAECSARRSIGGPGGITVGDTVKTVGWCLTQTGVQP